MANGPMKKCSTYLTTTKKIQIKSTVSSHLIPEAWLPSGRQESTETGSERELLHIVGRNVNWSNHYGKRNGVSSKN